MFFQNIIINDQRHLKPKKFFVLHRKRKCEGRFMCLFTLFQAVIYNITDITDVSDRTNIYSISQQHNENNDLFNVLFLLKEKYQSSLQKL